MTHGDVPKQNQNQPAVETEEANTPPRNEFWELLLHPYANLLAVVLAELPETKIFLSVASLPLHQGGWPHASPFWATDVWVRIFINPLLL